MTATNQPLPEWAVVGAEVFSLSHRYQHTDIVRHTIVRLTATQILTRRTDSAPDAEPTRWKADKWSGRISKVGGIDTYTSAPELIPGNDPRIAGAAAAQAANRIRTDARNAADRAVGSLSVDNAKAAIVALKKYIDSQK